MRLDKPIGSLLLLWPTLWAIWIATCGRPSLSILFIFIGGVVVMRSAGCVINDIADRNFDGKVRRTQHRPLVIGSITTTGALILFIVLCLVGLILVLQLNPFTLLLSVVGLLLAISYPFTKRMIHCPQLILGAAYAWSIPMVFTATTNTIPLEGWSLYAIATLWPVAYDSIYALMDREDDINIGIKSTAILFGRWDLLIIFMLQLFVLVGLYFLGLLLHLKFIFFISIAIAFVLVCYQLYLINLRTPSHYYRAFYNNHWLGFVIFLGIVANYLT